MLKVMPYSKTVFKPFKKVLLFVLFHFAIVKRFISNNYGSKYPILIDIASTVATFYFLCFSLTFLSICGFYKFFIYCYLLLRHGRNFHGMITGMDMLIILTPESDGSIHGLIKCSTEKSFNSKQIYNQLCDQITKKFFTRDVDKKLYSTREYTIMGYHYYKETFGVEVHDIVKFIEAPDKNDTDSITEKELIQLTQRYFNSDLPVKNKFNWDICLCLNPVQSEEGQTCFVIFTRMHHTLGDGTVIYNLLMNNLFQEGPQFKEYSANLINKCKNAECVRTQSKHVYKFGSKVTIDKPCILRDGKPHMQTIFTYRAETPSKYSYLEKIRVIRKMYPGIITFNVLLTAYSASLAEYYKKYSKPMNIPESMEITYPIQLDLKRYLNIFCSSDKIKLSNEVSSIQLTNPVIPRTKRDVPIDEYLVDRMLSLKADIDRSIQSMDIQANYIWSSVFYELLPYQITRSLCNGLSIQTMTSFMPGGPKVKLFNGDTVDDNMYFIPRQIYSTLALSINTYDDRLQIGITADEAKVESLDKLNEIRDGVFKYLDVLYEQCINNIHNSENILVQD